jgi:hypothetical protein
VRLKSNLKAAQEKHKLPISDGFRKIAEMLAVLPFAFLLRIAFPLSVVLVPLVAARK